MNQIFETIPADERTTFDDPWPALRDTLSSMGSPVPSPRAIANIMSSMLRALGTHENGSRVSVRTICDTEMAHLTEFALETHDPMILFIGFQPEYWSRISKETCQTAIKLLANLGYVKLTDARNFDDREFVCYHACAVITFENGQYKQQSLFQIFQRFGSFSR